MTLQVIMTAAGAQPNPPATINAELIANVTALVPGYTASLPGSLIEDMSSTCVAAIAQIDQTRVDLINSISPYTANNLVLNQMAMASGIPSQGAVNNTSVYVVFSGPAGFVINKSFIVSDGNYQYIVQDGGIIQSGGSTLPLYALASQSGAWSVAANTVTQLKTSIQTGITVTVTNPNTGTPGGISESEENFRSRVISSWTASAQGMASFLKQTLSNVPNVQQRLVSVQQVSGGWEVICGGGDPYLVAYAIYSSLFDITRLVGSLTTARNISVSLYDYPDTYNIVFVNPPQESLGVAVTWNTTATNVVSDTAIAQAAVPAIIAYVNSIAVGQPINVFLMQETFQLAIANILPPALLTRLIFTVTINGTPTAPTTGTGIIVGNPESYFYADTTTVTVASG